MGDISIQILLPGITTIVAFRDAQHNFVSGANNNLSWDVTLTSVAAGTYDVRVRARQRAGAAATVWREDTKSNALIVDNTTPVVTLIDPNGGNFVRSDQDYTVR